MSLLSDQHVPNVLPTHRYRPDQLVLVESSQMQRKGTAPHLLAAFKKSGLDYEARRCVQSLSAEDDLKQIRAA